MELVLNVFSTSLADDLYYCKRKGKVRRAKLNYLRNISGSKGTRIKEKRYIKCVNLHINTIDESLAPGL